MFDRHIASRKWGIAGIFMFAVRASTGNLADKMKVPIGDRLVAENSDHQP
jgi:hypothetical protein